MKEVFQKEEMGQNSEKLNVAEQSVTSLTTHFQLRDIQSPAYNKLQCYTPYHVNRLNEETASNLNFGQRF